MSEAAPEAIADAIKQITVSKHRAAENQIVSM